MDNKKIEDNMGLVYSVAKRFIGRGTEYEDLVQIGSIGLIKAVNNYDESLGFKFSTYAVPLIMGEIKRYLRDDGLIKVSRSIKENAGKIGYAKEKLSAELGRSPTIKELSIETGLKTEEIADAIEAMQPAESLYAKRDDEDNFVIDKIRFNDEEEDKTVDKLLVKELLDTLDSRSKKVMLLRYFKEETQQQIADKLGVSQVQVSRIEKKSLETLRKNLIE